MIIKTLENTDFNEIMDCFYESFSGYFVSLPTDRSYFKNRWHQAGAKYDFSYGAFEDDKLVGFIINCVDTYRGEPTAFNTGTGVIPDYRGRRLVKSMYEQALKEMAQKGIHNHIIEAITANKIAVKAYESVGFKIARELKCYNGSFNLEFPSKHIQLKEVSSEEWQRYSWSGLDSYSWENRRYPNEQNDHKTYLVYLEDTLIGYFIINETNGFIPQFEAIENANLSVLFSGIKTITDTIKINNVDSRLTEKNNFLKNIGLDNPVDQYELHLSVKK